MAKDDFDGLIVDVPLASKAPALQLGRLAELSETIRAAITKRIQGAVPVQAGWRKLLDEHLAAAGAGAGGELEEKGQEEKTAALKELAESRLSVLIGPAGTGKTTLLSVLCSNRRSPKATYCFSRRQVKPVYGWNNRPAISV